MDNIMSVAEIPNMTLAALLNAGLTITQAEAAWDIIIEHLGIAKPPDKPKRTRHNRSQKPKHKNPASDEELNWRSRRERLEQDIESELRETERFYSGGNVVEFRSEKEEPSKPKHTIQVSDMITDEVKRLKKEGGSSDSESKEPRTTTRKRRDGQW